MVFILGGDGTHAGANAIHNEVPETFSLFKKINNNVKN